MGAAARGHAGALGMVFCRLCLPAGCALLQRKAARTLSAIEAALREPLPRTCIAAQPMNPCRPGREEVRTSPGLASSSSAFELLCVQDAKPPDVNEILLLDEFGGVLEGMSSNVFVVVGGKVATPGEGVLVGTVRNLVLEVRSCWVVCCVFSFPDSIIQSNTGRPDVLVVCAASSKQGKVHDAEAVVEALS